MKFFHLSDLHLGKRVNEFSMLAEQECILNTVLDCAKKEKVDAVLICGDVYDKPVPPVEAIRLFDNFISGLSESKIKVLVISGNHDSADRLSFASEILQGGGVYIASAYSGDAQKCTLCDGFGEVNFYMLPFVKPANVSRCFPEEGIDDYTSAVRSAILHMNVDEGARNVLLCHQFVTGAVRSESEELSVGGSDNVDASVFSPFDYVALGHIHGPQSVDRPEVRYCGTPLKYSFSECAHKKSITLVEMGAKGRVDISLIPLTPPRDWSEIRGKYEDITKKSFLDGLNRDNYYKITLTDEEDVPEGVAKLRVFYPNLMALEYDNARTRSENFELSAGDVQNKTPSDLFSELYERQNGRPMTDEMKDIVKGLIEAIWEGE